LYSSPSIIGIIELKRMEWAGHAARMGEMESINVISGKSRKKDTIRKDEV
jgi:hypothetical protein